MSDLRGLAVIVVNYGSSQLLAENLLSTARSLGPDAQIIVVDNPSTELDRTHIEELSQRHRWLLITMPTNVGFGAAANAGAARAISDGSQTLLFLNPDARIDVDSTRKLIAATSDGTTIASPISEDPSGRPWFSGSDLYLDDGAIRSRRRRDLGIEGPRMEWLSGACLCIPSALWRDVGGFSEKYFLYWEDVDLSRRALDVGARLVVVDDATAIHDEGATHRVQDQRPEAKSDLYYYYNIRNRMQFAVDHLDRAGVRAWSRSAPRNAWQVLLRGGRRQFLHGTGPLRAAGRGVRDGWKIARRAEGARGSAQRS